MSHPQTQWHSASVRPTSNGRSGERMDSFQKWIVVCLCILALSLAMHTAGIGPALVWSIVIFGMFFNLALLCAIAIAMLIRPGKRKLPPQ